ncbi:hypothetical protein NDU88_000435 [Pleurodeles waltl]|uniref:Uncharacterized protein n=1 Tax=Pleurodeles waltl TaxID=8319 RepID=A0AAV7KPY6_PLEWA|nr:hypothetical protein NDU88_000435 [Pleurodeles waltl]
MSSLGVGVASGSSVRLPSLSTGSPVPSQDEEGEGVGSSDCPSLAPFLLVSSSRGAEVRGVDVAPESFTPVVPSVAGRGSIQNEVSGLEIDRLGLLHKGILASLTPTLQAASMVGALCGTVQPLRRQRGTTRVQNDLPVRKVAPASHVPDVRHQSRARGGYSSSNDRLRTVALK